MQIDIHDINIEKIGTAELPDEVFAVAVRPALLWEQTKAQLASRRRGTHSTKTRATVRGTGAKPYRQKGTGRARQGSQRATQFVGGGISMGPRPRDYSYRLPRSARKAALRSALSARVKEGNLILLDKMELEAPKTKAVLGFLGKVGSANALIVDQDNSALKLSARNLPRAKYLAAPGINVYDILKHEKLVITQGALQTVVDKAIGQKGAAEAAEA